MTRGAEFGELGLRTPTTGQLRNSFNELSLASRGLENGNVDPIAPILFGLNAFRLGQQIHFWIGITNPIVLIDGDPATANWLTRLQLKPWWLRPNLEYRSPGFPSWTGLDNSTFGPGPGADPTRDNKYIWIPSPKRLDVTPFQVPPPPTSPVRHSDSVMLDDVWTYDLQDPNDADYQADFPAPQVVSRWDMGWYPTHGYAIAFTWDAEQAFTLGPGRSTPIPSISLTYTVGTLGSGDDTESLG